MNNPRDLKHIALGAIVAVSGLSALAAVNLTTFTPGTPIKSSEVNANFSSLKSNIEALQAPVGASRLDVTGTPADGKVLKLQAGNLAWADDLTGGPGGAAYTAGAGLSLTNTTFSLADGGVTLGKLSATGGTEGKVLKISGGKLAWLDDIVGSPGSTYSADDSSLALTGTKFSIKDGGVTTPKLADGAVTSSKIAFPLSATGAFNTSGITVLNNSTGGAIALHGIGGEAVPAGSEVPVGVLGESKAGLGLLGSSESGIGVFGRSTSVSAVRGISTSGEGMSGESTNNAGVHGTSSTGVGVFGQSTSNFALLGINNSSTAPALKLQNQANNGPLIDAVGHSGGSVQTVFSVDQNGTISTFGNLTTFADVTASGSISAGGDVFARGVKLTSDRNAKTNFQSVNARAVLEKIAALPVTRWNYKSDAANEQHIGPMAQDFHAAFGLSGNDDTHISAVDAQGVALAAIKGMYQKNLALEQQVRTLEARLAALEKAVRLK